MAMRDLCIAGFLPDKLILLTPAIGSDTLQRMPSEDAEQPGMGRAIGSVAGGAAGLAAGALISNFLLPGVGPIVAVGLSSGAFGVGGAVAGGAVGKFLESSLTQGLPKDEIFSTRMRFDRGAAYWSGLLKTTIGSNAAVS